MTFRLISTEIAASIPQCLNLTSPPKNPHPQYSWYARVVCFFRHPSLNLDISVLIKKTFKLLNSRWGVCRKWFGKQVIIIVITCENPQRYTPCDTGTPGGAKYFRQIWTKFSPNLNKIFAKFERNFRQIRTKLSPNLRPWKFRHHTTAAYAYALNDL